MGKEHEQVEWNEELAHDLRQIVRMAVTEDVGRTHDWTTVSLVPAGATAEAFIVPREDGIVAGLVAAEVVLDEMNCEARCEQLATDGDRVKRGNRLARIHGPARDILTSERVILNLMGRLSGIATMTAKYVERLEGLTTRLYDTRKTTPGYRRLEKYAVRQGGGTNHRGGLHRAVLIKDNHIAFGKQERQQDGAGAAEFGVAESVVQAREFVLANAENGQSMIIEIEVDSLAQLEQVLPTKPDIVLLDNMEPETLTKAVALRDELAPGVELEASGGITLETIRAKAETGVERISVGALTHSARNFDVGLDWSE